MNRVVHFEIHGQDPGKLAEFYRKVFGWELNKWDNPGGEYWLVMTGPSHRRGQGRRPSRHQRWPAQAPRRFAQGRRARQFLRLHHAGRQRRSERRRGPGGRWHRRGSQSRPCRAWLGWPTARIRMATSSACTRRIRTQSSRSLAANRRAREGAFCFPLGIPPTPRASFDQSKPIRPCSNAFGSIPPQWMPSTASVVLRSTCISTRHPGSAVVHALQPQERLRILGPDGRHARSGVRPLATASARLRAAPPPSCAPAHSAAVFPQVDLAAGIRIPAVPISLPLLSFIGWLQTEAESPWLPPCVRRRHPHAAIARRSAMPSASSSPPSAVQWDAWVGEVMADGRLESATLDEWIVRQQGGRDMWSIRAERIFTDPSEHASTLGWVVPEDVLRWTGRVRNNDTRAQVPPVVRG